MTDRSYYGVILLCFLIIFVLVIGILTSINLKTANINKQLKTIVKLEQKQTATETQKETNIPELIIEENNLAN